MILKKIFSVIIIAIIYGNIFNVFAAEVDNSIETEIDISNTQVLEVANGTTEEPSINSRAAVVIDRNSGMILYSKNADEVREMASTTKIMTAIIVLENANLKDVVTVSSSSAAIAGSTINLNTNDKITVNDLLYGLMLKSGNDAAHALAEYVGGSQEGFAQMMNEKVKELGLVNTQFVTPHGLDSEGHYTTANELAVITQYALENEVFRTIVGTKTTTIYKNSTPIVISNINELLGNLNGVYGVKTGYTGLAGRCLVSSTKRGDMDIITVVLGADSKNYRTQDSIKLIEYVFKNFTQINTQEIIKQEFEYFKTNNTISVEKMSNKSKVILEMEASKYETIIMHKNKLNEVEIDIDYMDFLETPLERGAIIGQINLYHDMEQIENINIYIVEEIKRKDEIEYLVDIFSLYKEFFLEQML